MYLSGNSLEYDEDDTKATPKRKHRNSSQYVLSPSEDKIKKKKKKNRKKKSLNSEMFKRTKDELNLDKKQLSKKEQWLKDVLGVEAITDKSVSNHSCDQNQNVTLQTLSNHKRKFEPEVVVFHDPAKRKKKVVIATFIFHFELLHLPHHFTLNYYYNLALVWIRLCFNNIGMLKRKTLIYLIFLDWWE